MRIETPARPIESRFVTCAETRIWFGWRVKRGRDQFGLLPSDRSLTCSKVGCLLRRIEPMRTSPRLALKGLPSLVAALSLTVSCSTSPRTGGSNGASTGGGSGDAASSQDARAPNDSAPSVASDAGVLIGTDGGTFTTADGVTVEIPASALSSNVTITVIPAPNAPLPP